MMLPPSSGMSEESLMMEAARTSENVGRQLFYTAVHPRRQFWTSYSPPWEPEISHNFTWSPLSPSSGRYVRKLVRWQPSDVSGISCRTVRKGKAKVRDILTLKGTDSLLLFIFHCYLLNWQPWLLSHTRITVALTLRNKSTRRNNDEKTETTPKQNSAYVSTSFRYGVQVKYILILV
jgi:hypothetical protein